MERNREKTQREKQRQEGLTAMLCFQMALCLAAVGVFLLRCGWAGKMKMLQEMPLGYSVRSNRCPLTLKIWSSFGSSFVGFGREERVIFWRRFGILSRNRLFRPSSCPSRWSV